MADQVTDWTVIYDEWVGIVTQGLREPTADEHKQALKYADEYVARNSN